MTRAAEDQLCAKVESELYRNQSQFDIEFQKVNCSTRRSERHKSKKCGFKILKKKVLNSFPILTWLPNYSWRKQLSGDFMAGCAVAMTQIPQGMAYGLLGGVSPIVGIYMAFFPVLLYCIIGTSHHSSIGTFPVASLITGQMIQQYASDKSTIHNISINNETDNRNDLSQLDVAVAVCLMVGLWQIFMSIFNLGVVGIVLSEHLFGGFTTGAAIHIVVSQLKHLLGISLPKHGGAFKLIHSVIALFKALPTANPAEVITSTITITVLAVHNDWVKPWYRKRIKFPMPVELIALIVAAVTVRYTHLDVDYGLKTIGELPAGLPFPKSPPFNLLPSIAFDTVGLAVVSFVVSLSTAKTFANKRGYTIRSNQELVALGTSDVLGSFFSCMPVAASLPRSHLQESVGGETQLSNVVSCMWLLPVLMWIGPFFESVPLSILASITIVALKGMFMQYKDFLRTLKLSPLDAAVWMIAFLSVVIFGIGSGLIIGTAASITIIVYQSHCPYHAALGRLPGTDFYVDASLYPTSVEEPGIKVVRWAGGIQFSNAETFREVVSFYLKPIPSKRGLAHETNSLLANTRHLPVIKHLILDCSAVSYVDLVGTKCLKTVFQNLVKDNVYFYLAGCSTSVIERLDRCEFFGTYPRENVFPSVSDAVLFVRQDGLSVEN